MLALCKWIEKMTNEKTKNINDKNIENWFKDNVLSGNIFQEKLYDGCLYFIFYIVMPIIITSVSLIALTETDLINIASCYLTILISSSGCIYDAINRWENRASSKRNRKLCVMIAFLVFVTIYCLVVILGTLYAQVDLRNDYFLLAYLCSNIIALTDLINCINLKLAKQDTV